MKTVRVYWIFIQIYHEIRMNHEIDHELITDFKSMSRAIVAAKKKEKVVSLIADTGMYPISVT